MRKIIRAARPVRKATVKSALKPERIAHLPKTGARPSKKAEAREQRDMPHTMPLLEDMQILSGIPANIFEM
jgi:hypothetical protein